MLSFDEGPSVQASPPDMTGTAREITREPARCAVCAGDDKVGLPPFKNGFEFQLRNAAPRGWTAPLRRATPRS